MAENTPFARTMLRALMGRLQGRFSPRVTPTSKADVWRLAAVDPLMVSGGGGRGPRWGLSVSARVPAPPAFPPQTLCAVHLLIEKMDKDDKLPDLFPDLVYTLLLHLGSSHGPEALSPVLKTWRIVHSGTLPEDVNLQRYLPEGVARLGLRL